MPRARLYHLRDPEARLGVAVARYLGADVDCLSLISIGANGRDAVDTLAPLMSYSILLQADGLVLWDTDAIVCHLSRLTGSDLWRRDDREAEMIGWLSWARTRIMPSANVLYFEAFERGWVADQAGNPEDFSNASSLYGTAMHSLNHHLQGRTWLLGEHLSYADFRVASLMPFAKNLPLPLDAFPEVRRHAAQLEALPAWRQGVDAVS